MLPLPDESVESCQPTPSTDLTSHTARRRPRAAWAYIAGTLAIILAGAGYFIRGLSLAEQAHAAYNSGNCAETTALAATLVQQYPTVLVPYAGPAAAWSEECGRLAAAIEHQAAGDWPAAHEGYTVFLKTYPTTPLTAEAQRQLIETTFAWAEQQRRDGQYQAAINTYGRLVEASGVDRARQIEAQAQVYAEWANVAAASGNYAAAVERLQTILKRFPSSTVAPAASKRLSEVYLDWGANRRDAAEFAEAESIYQRLIDWASERSDRLSATAAQTQLARTYLLWSAQLQERSDFTTAVAKLQLVIATDPAPQTATDLASQARAALPQVYHAWGASLLKSGKFGEAINQYAKMIDLLDHSDPQSLASAQDTVARAHLAWSESLRERADFQAALRQIDQAQVAAATQEMTTTVQEARAATMNAFAHSSGEQARALISQTLTAVCEGQKHAATPLIASDAKLIRIALSGLNLSLSDAIQAMMPAELHYAACVQTATRRIERCSYTVFAPGDYHVDRERQYWSITLRDVTTGSVVAKKEIAGATPDTCEPIESFVVGQTTKVKVGGEPKIDTLEAWLKKFVR